MAELKWLEDLQALMEENSFTKAADKRCVTQPAFSRRIRQLESWLGVQLVDSQRKPIHILPEAREHEANIRALIHDFYQLRNSLQHSTRRQRTGFVVQHTLAVSHFPQLIQQIHALLPKHGYRLTTTNNEDCVGLFRNQVGFMLCYERPDQPQVAEDKALSRIVLGGDRLLPVAAANPSSATNTTVNTDYSEYQLPSQNSGEVKQTPLPLLLYPKGGFLAEVLAASCLPAALRDYPVEIVCESAFAISLKEMVLAGMGIAWLPEGLVRSELQAGRLQSLEQGMGTCELDIVLYYRSDGHADEAFEVLRASHLERD